MNSHQKISGIILAAGVSSRMGKTKQLMPFGKTTLLGQVVKTAEKSALDEIIVVLGHRADEIGQTLDLDLCRTKIVINTEYAKGQSTSLIKGLGMVSPVCSAAMFLLGDQPLVTAGIINRLITAFETDTPLITIPCCNGRQGNPVIIARPLFHHLTGLTADTGARVLFDRFKKSIHIVQIEDTAIFADVDTMADYEKIILGKQA